MKLKHILGACTLFAASPAFSATLFLDTFSPQQSGWNVTAPAGADFLGRFSPFASGPFNLPTVSLSVTAPVAGPGMLSFDVLAFNTLDASPDSLTFLGGGSTLNAFFTFNERDFGFNSNPNGATIVANGTVIVTDGTTVFSGDAFRNFGAKPQSFRVNVPVTLVAGLNGFSWSYAPLQDLSDESWGLDNVTLAGPAGSATVVPVPGAALLLATGLAGFGFAARRRKA